MPVIDTRSITYDDLMSVRTPVDLDISPDGKLLSVVTELRRDHVVPRLEREGDAQPGYERAGSAAIIDAESGEVLINWEWPAKVWSTRWAPDGSRLVAVAEVDGIAGLWACTIDGSDRRCLIAPVSRPAMPSVIGWAGSGRAIVLVDSTGEGNASSRDESGAAASMVDHLRNDPMAGLNAGDGLVMPSRDLLEIDVESGAARTIVAALPAVRGMLSPDGQWVACVGIPSRTEMSSFSTARSIEVRSIEDGRVIALLDGLTAPSFHIADPVWNPVSTRVAVVRDGVLELFGIDGGRDQIRGSAEFHGAPQGGLEPRFDPVWSADGALVVVRTADGGLWSVDIATRVSTPLALPDRTAGPQLILGPAGNLMGPTPRTALAVVRNPVSLERQLWELSLTGAAPRLLDGDSRKLPLPFEEFGRSAAAVARSGRAYSYYVSDGLASPPEISVMDEAGELAQVTSLNDGIAQLPHATTRYLHYQCGGEDYAALLHLPPGYAVGDGTIPVVVDAYPAGPLWVQGTDRWEYLQVIPPQLLTAQGWGVLVAGATPARDASTRAELIAPVLAAIDAVTTLGIADDRVALVGQSAGGYLANCAVTATTRFRAAIAFNGMANLSSHFGQLYVSPHGPLMHGTANAEVIGGGPPWAEPGRYIEKSPLFHLDKVETPLLLVHGTGDKAAMVQGADEMFVGLRRLGKPVEILRYHGEGHGPPHYTEPNRAHMYTRVLEFLKENLT